MDMDMSPKEYQAYVKSKAKKSPIVKDTALAFVIGGLLQIPANFCYAELASAYPEDGGQYVYFREAGSRPLAFLCG